MSPVWLTETPTNTATETTTSTLELTAETTELVLPTAELTTEVTAEQTDVVIPTLTDTATEPAPLLPEPVLVPVLSEAFHTGDLSRWNVGADWSLVPQEQGFALQVTDSDAPVISNVAAYDDVAVEMLVQTQTGTLNLHVRQTETDGYRLSVNPNGQVDLYHGELLLATTNVNPALPDQWRHVRFSAMGDTLRVTIDTVEVIALRDTTPMLTAGDIFFNATFPVQPDDAGQQFNTLLVDNIRFWIPESDSALTPVAPTLTASPTLWSTLTPTALPLPEGDDTFIVIQPDIAEITETPTPTPTATLQPGWFFIDVDWTWESGVTYNTGGIRSSTYTYTNPPEATLYAIQMTFTKTSGIAWGTWGIGNSGTSLMESDQIYDQFTGTVCGGDYYLNQAMGCVDNDITPRTPIRMYDTRRDPVTEWTFSFLVRSDQGHFGSGRFSNVRLLYYGTPPLPTPTPTPIGCGVPLQSSDTEQIQSGSVFEYYCQPDLIGDLLEEYRIITTGNWMGADGSDLREEILQGVQIVGTAFQIFSTIEYATPQEAFIAIMFLETSQVIEFNRRDDDEEFCTTNKDPNSVTGVRSRISCGGDNPFTQYTAVHELGHVFLHQTANEEPVNLNVTEPCSYVNRNVAFIFCIQDPNPSPGSGKVDVALRGNDIITFVFGTVTRDRNRDYIATQIARFEDLDPNINYGITADNPTLFNYTRCRDGLAPSNGLCTNRELPTTLITDWERGTRGWDGETIQGFGACANADSDYTISTFQQNPCILYDWILKPAGYENELVIEYEETAADMFLNWIYRTVAPFPESNAFSDNADGFVTGNYSQSTGAADDRYYWMNAVLADMFSYYGW